MLLACEARCSSTWRCTDRPNKPRRKVVLYSYDLALVFTYTTCKVGILFLIRITLRVKIRLFVNCPPFFSRVHLSDSIVTPILHSRKGRENVEITSSTWCEVGESSARPKCYSSNHRPSDFWVSIVIPSRAHECPGIPCNSTSRFIRRRIFGACGTASLRLLLALPISRTL